MIYISSKRKSVKTLAREFPGAVIVDTTSSSPTEFVRLSPFYPHGDIPVPNSEGVTASCVEAIWQGLKVFETADIDTSLFSNITMKNLSALSESMVVLLVIALESTPTSFLVILRLAN